MGLDVKLISLTPNAESTILYIARASSDQENTDTGLLRWLVSKKHWSPYMMAHAAIEFNTSRTIAHQIIRHWTLACLEAGEPPGVQEFSQRYAMPAGTVKYKARRQAEKNRQSSIDDLSPEVQTMFQIMQQDVERYCFERYKQAAELGIARESARFLLPEACKTKLYLAGSIRSWIHYFNERCGESCQLEHRVLALDARRLLAKELPVVSEALNWEADDGE